ncbi:MAG: CoA transferase [Rhodospirillaceae bacterium]|jgi:crotonobetainyl-CoA:carnitine CoA-transferase CaiB-like acyl-CoA transferase|nr:CoA transferase [Rhodospirillaceae bacterium]MBT5239407.1 CoA transferase [Rhodospirillaceae bacterium]MBT5564250.1 CoA transferase [Rhodospirillaceae bacterium]MBT6961601.1 CoA transferase [Rhodospirillaceae bacterium]MBT7449354.1 CoA transferase [Rhodospirillaceae bacterium]
MKLEGVRVIDLSMYLPGPHLTLMMADHGADVLRVEPPGGEPARKYGPFQDGHSVWFRNTHRGKKSICLNLKTDADREQLLKLCETADVFVEAFRPGVVKRLGVDYDAVKARNPKIIYCSVSAFGQTGPLSGNPTHDMGAQALTGLLAINDGGDGKPVVPGLPGADMGSSLVGLSGILMALYRREKTGMGDYVDASMYDTLLSWTAHLTGPVLADGVAPTTREGRSIGGAAFYNVYETEDGRFIALTGREPKFATSLLTILGRMDLFDLCCLDDCVAQEPVKEALREAFKSKTQAEWIDMLEPLELAWAPVLDMVEAFEQEHAIARDMIVTDPAGLRHVGNPIKFREEPAELRFDVPELEQPSKIG